MSGETPGIGPETISPGQVYIDLRSRVFPVGRITRVENEYFALVNPTGREDHVRYNDCEGIVVDGETRAIVATNHEEIGKGLDSFFTNEE